MIDTHLTLPVTALVSISVDDDQLCPLMFNGSQCALCVWQDEVNREERRLSVLALGRRK